jgi:hypothetical protein
MLRLRDRLGLNAPAAGGGGGGAGSFPTYVDNAHYGRNTTWSGTQIPIPAGIQADDLLVFVSHSYEGAILDSVMTTDGWTLLSGVIRSNPSPNRAFQKLWYRKATGSEVTHNLSSAWSSTVYYQNNVCFAVRGWDTAVPPEIVGYPDHGADDPWDHPGITPTFGARKTLFVETCSWAGAAAIDAYDSNLTQHTQWENVASGAYWTGHWSGQIEAGSFDPTGLSWDAAKSRATGALIAIPGLTA